MIWYQTVHGGTENNWTFWPGSLPLVGLPWYSQHIRHIQHRRLRLQGPNRRKGQMGTRSLYRCYSKGKHIRGQPCLIHIWHIIHICTPRHGISPRCWSPECLALGVDLSWAECAPSRVAWRSWRQTRMPCLFDFPVGMKYVETYDTVAGYSWI